MEATEIAQLVSFGEYREQRQHLFASQASGDWYRRQNRAGLVASGALILIVGRWYVCPTNFDNYVIEQGSRAAKAQVQASGECACV